MKSLSETWFAEGYIDFELKKYTLLAYLQEINKNFNEPPSDDQRLCHKLEDRKRQPYRLKWVGG